MTIGRFRGSGRSPALDRHAWWFAAVLLLLLLIAPAIARAQADTLKLSWTAPGDDGSLGAAASYEIRMATAPITPDNFANATILANVPVPSPAGERQEYVVRGLSRANAYWFAVRSRDDVGNWSPLSNVVHWTWPLDNSPPAAPLGLTAVVQGTKAVRLTWAPNSEPTVAGYVVYRSSTGEAPWERMHVQPLTEPAYLDERLPVDVAKVFYQVVAVTGAGIESPRSATVMAPVVGALSREPVTWKLRSAYPNPSRSGATVHLPVDVPALTGDARIEIHDSAGQRIRALPVAASVTGVIEVDWDGLNEHRQPCAPGVYRAWLVAPGVRQSLALARLP
ncbi:MAG: FlgD immunoglobulin-like domain containing protein [Candidatus Eisenbacteria bacterium]